MKKIIFFALFFLTAGITSPQWIQVNNTVTFSAFVKSGNNLVAGYTGVYTSTNNGNNWSLAGVGSYAVNSIVASGNNVLAGVYYGGIFLSTNNGSNWSTVPQNSMSIKFLAINQAYVYAAGGLGGGFYRSSNLGVNWSGMLPAGYFTYALGVKDSVVFASYVDDVMYNHFLVRSINNGSGWTETGSGLPDDIVSSIGFSDSRVFAGLYNGYVYYSTNNGSLWLNTSLGNKVAYCFASFGNNVFIATNNGFWVSTNNGSNWAQKDEGLTGDPLIRTLCVADNFIFAGIGNSVWRRPLSELITGIDNKRVTAPEKFSLSQNYPNPFNPSTKINYTLSVNGRVKLSIRDALGRKIAILVDEFKKAGSYITEFNGENLSSGIYIYSIETENFTGTKKMLLIK